MHIPPYYKKSSWQRFFIGVMAGAVVSYCVFAFMYSTMYEQIQSQNQDLQSRVKELQNQNDALLKDKEDMDEKSKDRLEVNSIEINITNDQELKDHLTIHQLEEMLKEEVHDMIGNEVSAIAENDSLLTKTIENKVFFIGDFSYRFTVNKLIFSTSVKIFVKANVTAET